MIKIYQILNTFKPSFDSEHERFLNALINACKLSEFLHFYITALYFNVDAAFLCCIPAVSSVSFCARSTSNIKASAVTSASGTTAVDLKMSEKPESPSVYCN